MIDFLIEFFNTLLEEVFSWLIGNSKIPKAIRYLIASIPHIGLLALFGILAAIHNTLFELLFYGAFFLLFLGTWIYLLWKIAKSK